MSVSPVGFIVIKADGSVEMLNVQPRAASKLRRASYAANAAIVDKKIVSTRFLLSAFSLFLTTLTDSGEQVRASFFFFLGIYWMRIAP